LFSKSVANTFGVPCIQLDVNAAKGGLVGESEANIRAAVDVIKAIGGRNVFAVASCNKAETIPAALRRRFRYGSWFFDAPNREEQKEIWTILKRRWEIPAEDPEPDEDLTGADVEAICDLAWRSGKPLEFVRQFQNPSTKSAPETIKAARANAMGKFLSATYPGIYQGPGGEKKSSKERTIDVE
jgi:SpoVK/Ycf46/Vps4 family AAA+-type ATPase